MPGFDSFVLGTRVIFFMDVMSGTSLFCSRVSILCALFCVGEGEVKYSSRAVARRSECVYGLGLWVCGLKWEFDAGDAESASAAQEQARCRVGAARRGRQTKSKDEAAAMSPLRDSRVRERLLSLVLLDGAGRPPDRPAAAAAAPPLYHRHANK